MKDSYSFDYTDAGLDVSYQQHRDAYERIFARLGLEYAIVQADAGAMGGSRSEEFLHPTPIGEDTFVRSAGGYAANVEAFTTDARRGRARTRSCTPAEVLDTPGTPTIATLVDVANAQAPAPRRTRVDGRRHPQERRARAHPPRRDARDRRRRPPRRPRRRHEARRGAVRPRRGRARRRHRLREEPAARQGLHRTRGRRPDAVLGEESATGIRYLLDPRVADGSGWITGANADGKHVFGLVAGRDFAGDGAAEVAEVRAGDPAPDGSGPVELARGMEIGHVFQLGRKYAEALGLQVLDENGKLVTVTMGSYGIGVTRILAVIAEANNDEKGLIWPAEVAPFDVHVIATGKDDVAFELAETVCGCARGRRPGRAATTTARRSRPGVKFGDAELLGVPTIVIVGPRRRRRRRRTLGPPLGRAPRAPRRRPARRALARARRRTSRAFESPRCGPRLGRLARTLWRVGDGCATRCGRVSGCRADVPLPPSRLHASRRFRIARRRFCDGVSREAAARRGRHPPVPRGQRRRAQPTTCDRCEALAAAAPPGRRVQSLDGRRAARRAAAALAGHALCMSRRRQRRPHAPPRRRRPPRRASRSRCTSASRSSSPRTCSLSSRRMLRHDDLVAVGDYLVTPDRHARLRPSHPSTALARRDPAACPRRARARSALADVRVGAESRMETLLRLLLIRAGLPEPGSTRASGSATRRCTPICSTASGASCSSTRATSTAPTSASGGTTSGGARRSRRRGGGVIRVTEDDVLNEPEALLARVCHASLAQRATPVRWTGTRETAGAYLNSGGLTWTSTSRCCGSWSASARSPSKNSSASSSRPS